MTTAELANQVLMEFGTGVIPEELLSFEDAEREAVSVRALELQKLGIASPDKTLSENALSPTTRDGTLSAKLLEVVPVFAEAELTGTGTGGDPNRREKVEIVPTQAIAGLEGARAIAFYNGRYRISWDVWDEGSIWVWGYDLTNLASSTAADSVTFPASFWTLVVKKAALNLIRVLKLKLITTSHPQAEPFIAVLGSFEGSIGAQAADWEREFFKWRTLDPNLTPHLRRTQSEIRVRGYNNITGLSPLDASSEEW